MDAVEEAKSLSARIIQINNDADTKVHQYEAKRNEIMALIAASDAVDQKAIQAVEEERRAFANLMAMTPVQSAEEKARNDTHAFVLQLRLSARQHDSQALHDTRTESLRQITANIDAARAAAVQQATAVQHEIDEKNALIAQKTNAPATPEWTAATAFVQTMMENCTSFLKAMNADDIHPADTNAHKALLVRAVLSVSDNHNHIDLEARYPVEFDYVSLVTGFHLNITRVKHQSAAGVHTGLVNRLTFKYKTKTYTNVLFSDFFRSFRIKPLYVRGAYAAQCVSLIVSLNHETSLDPMVMPIITDVQVNGAWYSIAPIDEAHWSAGYIPPPPPAYADFHVQARVSTRTMTITVPTFVTAWAPMETMIRDYVRAAFPLPLTDPLFRLTKVTIDLRGNGGGCYEVAHRLFTAITGKASNEEIKVNNVMTPALRAKAAENLVPLIPDRCLEYIHVYSRLVQNPVQDGESVNTFDAFPQATLMHKANVYEILYDIKTFSASNAFMRLFKTYVPDTIFNGGTLPCSNLDQLTASGLVIDSRFSTVHVSVMRKSESFNVENGFRTHTVYEPLVLPNTVNRNAPPMVALHGGEAPHARVATVPTAPATLNARAAEARALGIDVTKWCL